MDYWRGSMDWPLAKDWVCETCGENDGLEWGFIHGQCRCNRCHTQYFMRDDNGTIVTTPICALRDVYKVPARLAWAQYHSQVDALTDEQWDSMMPAKVSARNQ